MRTCPGLNFRLFYTILRSKLRSKIWRLMQEELNLEKVHKLISEALKAREKAYVPYSGFSVGAAILTYNGEIYSGFNIENASYPVCNCAERTALFRAVFDGHKKFSAIAVVGGDSREREDSLSSYCPPCGMCRQALREFCVPSEFEIILAKNINDFKIFTLEDLLPQSFGPDNL